MRRYCLLLLVVILSGFISCSEDSPLPPDPKPTPNPLFQVTVRDSDSQPVANLRVNMFYHLANAWPFLSEGEGAASAIRPMPASTIPWEIPVTCNVNLSIYDMADSLIAVLANESRPANSYRCAWGGQGVSSDGVYKCILTASDALNQTLFRDMVFAVLWRPDGSILGYTGTEGVFRTNNYLLFPNLISLPTLHGRDPENSDVGEFSYTDSVTIVLTDTLADVSQEYVRTIQNASNLFDLTWAPSGLAVERGRTAATAPEATGMVRKARMAPPTQFRLGQNFPNPFN
jgi:hypothetical protein